MCVCVQIYNIYIRVYQGVYTWGEVDRCQRVPRPDLKLDNIMMSPEENGMLVRVIDFGLAKIIGPPPEVDRTDPVNFMRGTSTYGEGIPFRCAFLVPSLHLHVHVYSMMHAVLASCVMLMFVDVSVKSNLYH